MYDFRYVYVPDIIRHDDHRGQAWFRGQTPRFHVWGIPVAGLHSAITTSLESFADTYLPLAVSIHCLGLS